MESRKEERDIEAHHANENVEDNFTKVWIEDDCITCDICEITCPEVFLVEEESSVIISSARVDNQTSTNIAQRAPLKNHLLLKHRDDIIEALEGCPVEVIRIG